MLAYQAGRIEAFEKLFDRYKSRIYDYFLRHIGDWAVAEDLFQKTFLRLHDARARYQPTASFVSWIYTIATNLLRDEVRKERNRPQAQRTAETSPAETVEQQPAAERAGPEMALGRRELRDRISAAVRALPVEQKEAFILGKYEGRSYQEIAEILGCSEGAVKVRIHRALKVLKISLGEFAYEV